LLNPNQAINKQNKTKKREREKEKEQRFRRTNSLWFQYSCTLFSNWIKFWIERALLDIATTSTVLISIISSLSFKIKKLKQFNNKNKGIKAITTTKNKFEK
jgi:hypothetical protein